jgi:tRNA (mo5U34)-methyltransferase
MHAPVYTEEQRRALQAEVDAVPWYHEFDFPGGIKAPSPAHADVHRPLWRFMYEQLDRIDFAGKSVIDLGCWDGYWSFYAERRGAASVLATDDASQNWAGSRGLLLAKRLLGSRVETDLSLSVYDVARVGRRFDVVLCLGLYYHLHDPFLAFANVRHLLAPGGVAVVEGNVLLPDAPAGTQVFDLAAAGRNSKFTPDLHSLKDMLRCAYLEPSSVALIQQDPAAPTAPPLQPPGAPPGWRWRLRMCWQALRGSREGVRELARLITHTAQEPPLARERWGCQRALLVCTPVEGESPEHLYRPPLGLHQYDPRFRGEPGRAAA